MKNLWHLFLIYCGLKAPLFHKEEIQKKLKTFQTLGINTPTRKVPVIVSLTSFPERIHEVPYVIYSLLTQTLKPDRVILWLAEEQFPQKERELPKALLKLKENGLTIKWCSDIRSYKKLVPTLKLYPEAIIVTADDDIYYPSYWLKKLYLAHQKDKLSIIGHRCHKVKLIDGKIDKYKNWHRNVLALKPSYHNFLTTGGGVLYPPHSLYPDAIKTKLFEEIAPYADDIWFWGMGVLQGTKFKNVRHRMRKLTLLNPLREQRKTNEITLAKINILQDGNNKQMNNLLKKYPKIMEKLLSE